MNLSDNVFRANVGAVIMNDKHFVLAFERSAIKDAWQFPQGGINEHETAHEAIMRELTEETDLQSSDLQLIAEYKDWLAYELPKDKQGPKYGRGQVQKWFLFKLIGEDTKINLNKNEREFSNWKWMSFEDILKKTAPFRIPIYEKLRDFFNEN
jgi:putative (di)nucleoside polyphosphate hydrolase